jgi:hypothetical protein
MLTDIPVRSGTLALSICVSSVGAEVESGVVGVLANEEQAGVETVEAVADVVEIVACRLTVFDVIPQGTSRLMSGNALVPGTAQSDVAQQRSCTGRGGRTSRRNSNGNTAGQRYASATSTASDGNTVATSNSESNTIISERGSQNGRGFGRSAYNS